jgi:omega-6 fatty acid desaturase (delta-12 desaturase)
MSDMTQTAPADEAKRDKPFWRDLIAPYERPNIARSTVDLATSVVPYLLLSVAGYLVLDVSVWLTLGLSVIASGFLLRTFIVFHDCAHGSFFASKEANTWVGRLTAFLTFQAFADWRHKHAVHHGSAGDLDRRGTGDVHTMTLDEYVEAPWKQRLAYRLFRNPIVMFGIGPIWALMIGPRIWSKSQRKRQRNSVLLTNIGFAVVLGAIWWFVGFGAWAAVQMPAAVIAGTAGVFLFYVQHQFEDAYWESADQWSYAEAALRGSSYLRLPQPFQFFTGNIGLHHVHHLSAKVPNYNLQSAHDEQSIFHDVPVLTAWDGVKAVRLKVIDPANGRLLTWADVRGRRTATATPSPAGF